MNNIYFKKVIARGPNKKESSIDFQKGLNIICGPSNSGKTFIFKIFKQVFGTDNNKYPNNDDSLFIIGNSTGYTNVSLVISKDDDDIILTRDIDSDIIHVESYSPYVKAGDYTYTVKKGYKPINDALLQIFNIEPFKIPQKKDGTAVFFSLKFLNYLFFADEERIDQESQILLAKSKKYNPTTQSMANLLYLIYDMDFTHYLKDIDLEKIKFKRGAVKKYITERITNNSIEIKKINEKLEGINLIDKDSNMLQKQLDETRSKIDAKYKEIDSLNKIINELVEKIGSDALLIDRLKSLSNQYKSDLERLNFISSGKDDLDANHVEHECPYCHSLIHEENVNISIDDIKLEAESAIHNLNEVSLTLKQLLNEHENDEKKLKLQQENLFDVKKDIDKLIEERVRLEYSLRKFDELIEYQKRIKYLKDDNESLEKDLFEMSSPIKVEREDFIPINHFKTTFFDSMTDNIKSIMKYCGDLRYTVAEFDKDSFDISIKGEVKSSTNGKGFRSFLNSVTLLAFRKYLEEKGKHKLPVYVIDSPLKNLDVGDLDKDNIKNNFIKYLVNASKNGQIIIIENTNNFSITKELKENANIIEFTHDVNLGRYGFLLDYYDWNNQNT